MQLTGPIRTAEAHRLPEGPGGDVLCLGLFDELHRREDRKKIWRKVVLVHVAMLVLMITAAAFKWYAESGAAFHGMPL